MKSVLLASIPSPSQAEWYLGPIPLRGYALSILAGIVIAVWLTIRRFKARGEDPEVVYDITLWAVPFGIIGGRLYHVISSPRAYFGEGGDPIKAFYIWEGGLGIWGAIALGAVGAWIGCRRANVKFSAFADAVAPGLLIAQATGRLGNWFNQELFGGPTTLPWGLEIDDAHLPAGFESGTLFHPTFLYELLWCLAAAALLLYLDRKIKFRPMQLFFLYIALYTLGRLWIEMLRIDTAEMVLGLRLNVWTSILVLVGGTLAYIWAGRRTPPEDGPVALATQGSPDEQGDEQDGKEIAENSNSGNTSANLVTSTSTDPAKDESVKDESPE
ncbi:prolipoprotein diacylglyceryl transferase [Jonesiaceae bacterium BS-20]|uniref:Phosphatidylglycerol--prolipoprotein diacylglyceryl transferase n=1 Tax=Jonesiaceae bacterium BS-20 TaxID=3120821 RepID=A0AAU7DZY9_9MICO